LANASTLVEPIVLYAYFVAATGTAGKVRESFPAVPFFTPAAVYPPTVAPLAATHPLSHASINAPKLDRFPLATSKYRLGVAAVPLAQANVKPVNAVSVLARRYVSVAAADASLIVPHALAA
jgi:hypothetical protein